MATFSSVTRHNVLQAIAEYDERGGEEFLDLYGFAPSRGYTLVHEGRSYDSKAVLGVAHRYATGRLATPDEFHGGMQGAVSILRKRGFEVTEPAGATRPTPVRATRTRTPVARATPVREAEPATCPTCFMTLPATGICDQCG
ncbi:hypothetical protein [Cellulomonas sp. URHE0023]|uniref:hypothetical protein n=1 Tax=Cellulomonas sp. URHE0023 TaxID=1380354 RepID=UPI00048145AD|nr:hypothetical protein [Cellulomonas sp. URHE0023]